MKHTLYASVSVLALAFHPSAVTAQTSMSDKFQFDRYDRRIDMAAAYTSVLAKGHLHVRAYINGTAYSIANGALSGNVSAQEAYVSAIARSIEQTEQPPTDGSADELPSYPYVQMAGFDVAHRYCDGQLVIPPQISGVHK